jgi:hypothetical protein
MKLLRVPQAQQLVQVLVQQLAQVWELESVLPLVLAQVWKLEPVLQPVRAREQNLHHPQLQSQFLLQQCHLLAHVSLLTPPQ